MKNSSNFNAEEYNSEEIWRKDKENLLHPWVLFDSFQEEGALAIAEGEGSFIYDTDGKRYLDAVGGLWCNNLGLRQEEMVSAITEQARKMAYASPFVDMTTVPSAELAAKLVELAPDNITKVFFTTGGSTAVDSAYRLIQYYQNCRGKKSKKHFISRENSYHGSTLLSMSLGGKKGDHPEEFDFITDGIHHISCPNFYRAEEGLTESDYLKSLLDEFENKILSLGAENVAAFIAEPIMGAGGVIVAPDGYHKGIYDICKQYDVLYIADEVVTAFGRLGCWFASEAVFGIKPDIITCAKGLTSGYQPLGAMLFSDEIWEVIAESDQGRCFANGYTYSGHPIACAAALKAIEITERDRIFEHVNQVGGYFQDQLETLSDLPIVGDVRGRGLMACVEFVKDKNDKSLFDEELDIGKRIANHADLLGLIVRPIVHLNVMSPPLIYTKEDVDFTVVTLRKAIEATVQDLKNEGLF